MVGPRLCLKSAIPALELLSKSSVGISPLRPCAYFFGKSRDLENSAVRLFFGEISPNLSERLFTIFFQYFS